MKQSSEMEGKEITRADMESPINGC